MFIIFNTQQSFIRNLYNHNELHVYYCPSVIVQKHTISEDVSPNKMLETPLNEARFTHFGIIYEKWKGTKPGRSHVTRGTLGNSVKWLQK